MIARQQSEDEIALRRYLLGETSGEEQRTVELRLLSDQEYFDLLGRCEEELTDEYARGAVSAQDKERFEGHFLNSPERRGNLEFAKAFNQYVLAHRQRNPAKASLFPKWPVFMEAALMAAVAILIVALAWSVRTTMRLREQVEQNRAQLSQADQREKILTQQMEQQREQITKLVEEVARLESPTLPPEPDVVSLVLAPGISRSGDSAATAHLGSGIHRLQLDLKTELAAPGSYHAELQTVEGKAVWVRDGLKARQTSHGNAVRIVVPTKLLHRSDYLLVLKAINPPNDSDQVATYYFHVVQE